MNDREAFIGDVIKKALLLLPENSQVTVVLSAVSLLLCHDIPNGIDSPPDTDLQPR